MVINQKAAKTIADIDYINYDISKYEFVETKEYLHDVFDNLNTNKIYVKPGVYALSSKKLESLIKLAEIQKYYIRNPVRFIDDFFNIELLDAQAYIVQRSWLCPNVLLVCSRG